MKPIRVGFVGLGGICRERHVPGLRRIEGVEIVAVANRGRESSERVAQEFGIPVICDRWEDLVVRDDLDAVFIGTWPYMHCPVSLAALDAGKHVFCQARMAMNYAEAKAMWDKARETGLVAMLCPAPIGLSIDAAVARLLREDQMGEVRLVRVQSFSNAFADPEAPLHWRKDHRMSGLNMFTLGMYVEVVHRWFGWTWSVGAQNHVFVQERRDAAGQAVRVKIPDQVLFHAVMEGGFPVQYVFSAVVHHGKDQIEIYGTKATLRYEVDADALFIARAGEPGFQEAAVAPEDAYDVKNWRVEKDFIDAIREGAPYHPNFEDGVRYMQVIQAVYDSAEQQKTIVLESP